MKHLLGRYIAFIFGITILFVGQAFAVEWIPVGPYGGDARSFAVDPKDPKHVYLGTTIGWIYESQDGGGSWKRLARVDKRDDLVVDNIEVDQANPKHLIVGAWVLGQRGGGLFQSRDSGHSWTGVADLKGQSVRSLAGAPSDPKVFVAGTLEAIYRTTDGGEHWKVISPVGSMEIHEVESVAIDPRDPAIIYAGTWHLPWKTTDAGEHWNSIKEGVIDDSDVFSIIVDPKDSKVVYASACSGIYKSEDAGEKFQKVQGIPSTARRTRVLMQNPIELGTVYAGTTEGLFRTMDAGKAWSRTTGPEVIVNDVFIDPSNTRHVLLATDRGGVLASEDGGTSFQSSNSGFTVRQVVGYVADPHTPSTVFVSVLNDKEWGGVFGSKDGGLSWQQQSAGLGGRDVFSLGEAADGTVIAGTGHGIFRLEDAEWKRVDDVDLSTAPVVQRVGKGKGVRGAVKGKAVHSSAKRRSETREASSTGTMGFDGGSYSIASSGDSLYAATSEGLLSSTTAGKSWKAVAGVEKQTYSLVAAEGPLLAVATLRAVFLSKDEGTSWSSVALPGGLTQVGAMALDDAGGLWLGGREGVWVTSDAGSNWKTVKGMFVQDVTNLFFERQTKRMYVAADSSTRLAYMVQLPDMSVRFWDTGWNLRFVRPMGDHLVAATLFDGMVVQPRMVDSLELKPAP